MDRKSKLSKRILKTKNFNDMKKSKKEFIELEEKLTDSYEKFR